jgi:hypothetical protein
MRLLSPIGHRQGASLADILGPVGRVHVVIYRFVVQVLDSHGIVVGTIDEGGPAHALDAEIPLGLGAIAATDVWRALHYDRPDRGHDLASVRQLGGNVHGVRAAEVVDCTHGSPIIGERPSLIVAGDATAGADRSGFPWLRNGLVELTE